MNSSQSHSLPLTLYSLTASGDRSVGIFAGSITFSEELGPPKPPLPRRNKEVCKGSKVENPHNGPLASIVDLIRDVNGLLDGYTKDFKLKQVFIVSQSWVSQVSHNPENKEYLDLEYVKVDFLGVI